MAALTRKGEDGVHVSAESTYSGTYVITRLRGDICTELYLLPEEALELAESLFETARVAIQTRESYCKEAEL